MNFDRQVTVRCLDDFSIEAVRVTLGYSVQMATGRNLLVGGLVLEAISHPVVNGAWAGHVAVVEPARTREQVQGCVDDR